MLNENVAKLLKAGMWDLATCANGAPNVVPVAFKDVTAESKLVVGDVFLDTTPEKVIVAAPPARTTRRGFEAISGCKNTRL